MGNVNRPVILKEDMDLFCRIAKHGFVDMTYIQTFAYPGRKKRTIDDRIYQLSNHRFLSVTKTFIPPDYTTNYRAGYRIISLGVKAIRLLNDNGHSVIDNIRIIQNSSPYRMYHQVQVATVCDLIEQRYSYHTSKWEVYKILNEKEAFLEEGFNQPDALILFKPKQDLITSSAIVAVFIEIERSYASQKSLERKLTGYKTSISKNMYKEKLNYNIVNNRILFVAQTQGQKDALVNKILESTGVDSLHILIGGYEDVTHYPLDAIFTSPKDTVHKYKLLGKLP